MIKVASCDDSGSVYLGDKYVYRIVPKSEREQVLAIINLVNTDFAEIIETDVITDSRSLPEIVPENGDLVLMHRKIDYISYPHEWCAAMLKDAAIFHFDLSIKLLSKNIHLKDSHPWNILFARGQPIFVDFTSLVTEQGLLAERFLESNKEQFSKSRTLRLARAVSEIMDRMTIPYFLAPLLFYATGERSIIRARIENTTLNAATSFIKLRECAPRRLNLGSIKKFIRYVAFIYQLRKFHHQLQSSENLSRFYGDMRACLNRLSVTSAITSYSQYYSDKGEDQQLTYAEYWNSKQKEVHDALNVKEVNSVLDVACNTGWFALMAEMLDKRVVAFDIDESCVEVLYQRVRKDNLNILPLVIDFTNLTQNRYSIYDGNPVLIDAKERLKSDAVLVLGIIHHLFLGVGLSFEDILDSLFELFERKLIIEFIDPNDDKILEEPSFFPAYYSDPTLIEKYNINALINLLEERKCSVTIRPSHPETRKILVCEKIKPKKRNSEYRA